MRFNFPEKTEMESVSFFIKKTTLEKIQQIAAKHECTEKEVCLTLIEEAIEDYEEMLRGKPKIEPPVIRGKDTYLDLDKAEEETVVSTDNPFIRKDGTAPSKERKDGYVYCQYAYCMTKSKTHLKSDMIEQDGLLFCRVKCADEWKVFQDNFKK